MPLSHSAKAYEDCYELLDAALRTRLGIRNNLGADSGGAQYQLMRLHQARKLDREKSRDLFPEDDPRYGLSVYDTMVMRIRQHPNPETGVEEYYIYIEPRKVKGKVEEIEEDAASSDI